MQAIKDDALELTNAAIKEQLDNTKDTLRKIVQLPVTEHGLKRRAIEAMGVERLLQLPLCFGAVSSSLHRPKLLSTQNSAATNSRSTWHMAPGTWHLTRRIDSLTADTVNVLFW